MAEYTPNLGLKKPASGEFYDVQDFNDNSDLIDTALGNIANNLSAENIAISDPGGLFEADDIEGALSELFTSVSNGKTSIATAITDMGQTAEGSETFTQLAGKIRDISDDANAGVADVLTTKTFYQGGAKRTGTMPNRGAVTITPGTANQAITAGYHNGSGYVAGDVDLVSTNIKAGVNIFGVAGNSNVVDTSGGDATAAQILSGKKAYVDGALVTGTISSKSTATITPGTTNQTIAAGQYLSGVQTIAGDTDLIAANIKSGKNIFGVAGSLVPGVLVSAQQGIASISNSSLVNVTISAVDTAKSIVIVFAEGGFQGGDESPSYIKGELTSSTNLKLSAAKGINNAGISWQVIEFTNLQSLQSGNVILTDAVVQQAVSVSAVNIAKSMLIFSYSADLYAYGDLNYRAHAYGAILSPTSIRFKRINDTDGVVTNIQWYLVEFP